MTIPVNKLSIDVFQHETEDKFRIFEGMSHLFPENYHSTLEKLFQVDIIEGYHKNKIIRYSIDLTKNKKTQNLFIFLIQKILQSTTYFDLFDRISESGEMFIRLNKQNLVKNGTFTLDSGSDVYKIVIKFLFFNKKVDKIKEIYDFLQSIPVSEGSSVS